MPIELIIILSILAVLVIFGIVFILGPSICMFFMIFGKGKCRPFESIDLSETYYSDYENDIRNGISLLKSRMTAETSITARDGTKLCADLAFRGSNKIAVLVHGYHASPTNNFHNLGNLLYDEGYDLLMIHQRAHGKSNGRHCSFGIIERFDLLDWLDWLKNYQNVTDIVVCGVSMGATTAALAIDKITDHRIKALTLDCGFISPEEQMKFTCRKFRVPFASLVLPTVNLFVKLFIKGNTNVSTLDTLSRTQLPILFIHGTADSSVPYSSSERNFAACSSIDKELLLVEDAEHTLAISTGGNKVKKQVLEFLDKYVNKKHK